MTDKQPSPSRTAMIFVSGKTEETAVLRHLSEVSLRFDPFRIGLFEGWRVAVLNLEECDPDNGLYSPYLKHLTKSSLAESIQNTFRAGEIISEFGTVSVEQLLKIADDIFSPEISLFIGLSTSDDKNLKVGDVVVANTFYSTNSEDISAILDAQAVCGAGTWPRRGKEANAKARAFLEAVDGFPTRTGTSRISAIPGTKLSDFPGGPNYQHTLFIRSICGSSDATHPRAASSAAAFSMELLAHRMGKTDDLHTLHSQLIALSPEAFERVVGAGLSGVLATPFRQAASGRQLSGDVGGGTVRVEAKRYRTGVPSNRDLLGGLDSMAREVPDLSHWVVASTAELPLQAVDELALAAQERQIREVILDWPQAGIPPLAGLLTLGRAEVARQLPELSSALDRLAGRADVLRAGEEVLATLRSMPMGRPLYNPVLPYVPGRNTPRDALDARYRVVPLMHRDKEMKGWLEWARGANRTRSRLLTGDGGMGKTRLLIEVCEALRADGWCTGFLLEGVNSAALQRQLTGSQPFLIVVDYAERRASDIETLCEALRTTRSKVMLVMLARNDGRWREDIVTGGGAAANALDDEDGLQILQLEPAVPLKAEHARAAREDVFFKALQAFGFNDIIPTDHPPDFADPKYDRILLLLLEAWAIAFGQPGSRRTPIQAVLDREQRYLKSLAPDGIPQRTMMEVLAWIYYARDAAIPARRDALKLLKECPSLEGQPTAVIDKLVDIFHDIYPGPHFLNPIQPDLIGHAVMEKYGP
ncbi:hypothetical protein [Magnetospirillum aberrantis]|uniref:Novel STAND NTPase 5 domain-containing protein n=1 Tax=Magnetospirillum aberrantis SpK TaxID=908842 RepID=A0A7C9QTT3_9PROT|nr:hypothetical protein [Magnetospirillum aberrantis]NFV80365.1 hypothetical protein [Magnetospirillum aberrantis SpK]